MDLTIAAAAFLAGFALCACTALLAALFWRSWYMEVGRPHLTQPGGSCEAERASLPPNLIDFLGKYIQPLPGVEPARPPVRNSRRYKPRLLSDDDRVILEQGQERKEVW